MAKVRLDFKRVEKAAIEAHKEVALLLGRTATEIISEVGAFSEFPDRDLVDTGALRASQQIEFPKVGVGRLVWDSSYAIYQHEGFTLRNGRVWQGRPWTKEAIARLDIQKTFETLLESKL